jgi:phosphate starvation-inducible PhoH-like protein
LSKAKQRPRLASDNTLNFNDYVTNKRNTPATKSTKSIVLTPKTLNQETYISLLTDQSKPIIFAAGPAGTGKTMLAVLAGLRAYRDGQVKKLVLTRPAVSVEDEQHGFLPGDLVSKMEPWTRPIIDVVSEYYSPKEITRMIDEQIIEISPLAFMRGRNFKDSWIIADEMQNATPSQLKMLLTRLSDGSKIVITGDLNQTDIVNNNGLADLINRLKLYQRNIDHNITETINIVEFQKMDIERSDVVKKIIDIYDFNYIKKSNETKSVTMPLLQETNNFRDTTITSNNTCNIVSANNSTIIKSNKYNVISNDAALIPKHHITKNRDIFFDNSLM